MDPCRLCESRKSKRYCPGLRSGICAPCCGAEREVTVDCPLDCEYLVEARLHEKTPEVDPDQFPNKEIRLIDTFIREHADLVSFSARALLDAAVTSSAVDLDIREALEAIIRTHKTMDTGLIYQTRPQNLYAARVQQKWNEDLEQYRRAAHEATGLHTIRDSDVLLSLVFLQRLEIQHNNGRRRGRAFVSFLLEYFSPVSEPAIGGPEEGLIETL